MRTGAGEIWVDDSLKDWPENDYRIFVGDLGKETTTEMLAKIFQPYKSFAKAKVRILQEILFLTGEFCYIVCCTRNLILLTFPFFDFLLESYY